MTCVVNAYPTDSVFYVAVGKDTVPVLCIRYSPLLLRSAARYPFGKILKYVELAPRSVYYMRVLSVTIEIVSDSICR